jgi:branched-chain amino acid transport system substrate-binding protein
MVIGTVGILSGPLGDMFRGGVRATQAWVAATNAKGGVKCHKFRQLIADDGNDPARNRALIRRFVEQDKVVAFIFNPASLSGQASADYLNEKKVPVIGQEGGQLFFQDSPMHFSLASDGIPLQRVVVAAGAQVLVPQGKTKVATLTCQEADYCNTADRTYAEAAPAAGFNIVYRAKAALTQPDFTSHCLEARNAGAEAFITGTDVQSNYRLLASCSKLGYKPPVVLASLESNAGFKDDPNLEGAVIAMNNLPWVLSGHPAVAEYLTAVKEHMPGTAPDAAGMNGWTAAKGLERALRDIGPAAVTSEDVLKGLYTFAREDLGGLTFPLTFTPEREKDVACGWVVLTAKGKFTSDGKMFCVKGYEP